MGGGSTDLIQKHMLQRCQNAANTSNFTTRYFRYVCLTMQSYNPGSESLKFNYLCKSYACQNYIVERGAQNSRGFSNAAPSRSSPFPRFAGRVPLLPNRAKSTNLYRGIRWERGRFFTKIGLGTVDSPHYLRPLHRVNQISLLATEGRNVIIFVVPIRDPLSTLPLHRACPLPRDTAQWTRSVLGKIK